MPAFRNLFAVLSRVGLLLAALAALVVMPARPLLAQHKIPVVNVPEGVRQNTKHLEIEMVNLQRLGAMPHELRRKPGKFILMVVNDTRDPSASFVVEPAGTADGTLAPNPLLRFGGPKAWIHDERLAGVIDAPVGSFDLKSAATGKVLCKITIE